jgi:predicted amidohydrolase YtcJ
VHFVSGGLQLSRVQLRDAASADEFVQRIAEHARTLDANRWITGGGWDEQRWTPYAMPTRQLLEGVANPVFLARADMHMALANARALELAGITRDTPDPAGGTIVRDAEGEPTGILKDAAMKLVAAIVPLPSIDERIAAARAGLAEVARFGVTSFCDMGITDEAFDDFRAYQRLDRDGALTARVSLYMPIGSYGRLKHAGVEKRFGGERLRIGGLKGFADGSLGSSTAAMREPFTDEPDHCGLVMEAMSDGSMARWVADADAHELQIAIHAIGDRANADVLSIFEARNDTRARRFRIEHAQHLDASLIERFARSGIRVSFVARCGRDGDVRFRLDRRAARSASRHPRGRCAALGSGTERYGRRGAALLHGEQRVCDVCGARAGTHRAGVSRGCGRAFGGFVRDRAGARR